MSSQAPKVDFGSKIVFLVSTVAILLVVYILLNSLVNTYKRNVTKGEVDKSYLVEAASANLKPIGAATVAGAVVKTASAGRGGKEIYDAVCTSCHATGLIDSPKLDDKAGWEKRAAGGLDALLLSATNGKGAMPAKGGDPSLSDAEVKAVVLYMTKTAGLDLGGASPEAKKEAAPKAEVAAAPKKEEAKVVKTEEKKEAVKTVEAPIAPTEPKSPAEPKIEKVAEAAAAVVAVAAPVVAEKAAPSADGAALYVAKGCGACHGADAKTPIMALYPKISGQSKAYITTQLQDIKSGNRNNGQSVVMKGIMAGVSEAEITTLADYLSSLR